MPVLFLIAIVVVLVGIFFAATGRGGQLAYEPADHAPLDLGPVSASDVGLLRPPTALWGYNMQVTDAALDQISRAIRERDVTIAYLQEQIVSLARGGSYAESRGTHARLDAGRPLAPEAQDIPPDPGVPWATGDTSTPEPAPPTDTLPRAQDTESLPIPQDAGPVEAATATEYPAAPETSTAAETPTDPEIPVIPEPPAAPAVQAHPADATTQAARPPQTPLVLKASAAAKAPPAPEPHEATQPNEALQDPESREGHEGHEGREDQEDRAGEPTQPSETLNPHDTQGPQGTFDTYGWWAEQKAAAREEAAQPGAGPGQGDDPLAAAEEQGW